MAIAGTSAFGQEKSPAANEEPAKGVPGDGSTVAVRQTPLPIEEAMRQFEIAPGLAIELVASEPEVIDPVSAAFDHRGRLWVVEMRDYPTGPLEGEGFGGRIKLLTDADADGRFESSKVFADKLVFPTGVQPYRDGVIATLAGEVVYLADTDGDGVCDLREVWFTGFSQDNEQLRANHPTWTMENEIHVASGLRGGEVRSNDPRWAAGDKPLSLATRDFRFSPLGGSWRAVAGNSQFGFYQDELGRSHVCSNRNPSTLLLAEASQVEANPLLPLTQWKVDVMPAAEQSQVFPLVSAWTTSNLHAGQFTAACGTYRYQSDLLADVIGDSYFACEPTGSLVQRYRPTGGGVVPTATRDREGAEFLASRDPWFRPVDLFDGPDGAMYVVDMHRAVIEHPAWMPKELQQRGDLRWGNTAGRIYRIVAGNVASKGKQPAIDLEMAAAVELVDALGHPNRWRRETAARRIVEEVKFGQRIDIDAVAPLLRDSIVSEATAKSDGTSGRGATRALWLLHTLGRLTINELAAATRHSDAAVRLQAVRLLAMRPGEPVANRPGEPVASRPGEPVVDRPGEPDEEMQTLLAIQAEDSSPIVRYQFLLEWAMRGSDSIRAMIAASARPREGDAASDRLWIGNALSLVSEPIGASLLRDALADPSGLEGSAVTTWGPLAKRLGWAGSAETLAALMGTKGATADGLFAEFASGLAVRGTGWATLSEKLDPAAKVELGARLSADRQRVLDESLPMEQRLVAFRRVSLDRGDATRELCLQILKGRGDELFVESLQTVRHFPVEKLPELLVSRVTQLPPRATTAVVAAMIGNASWTPSLLDAIEAGNVPWGLIDPTSMGRLQRHSDAAIAQRVKTMLAGRTTVDRQELVRTYTEGLAQNANPLAGKAVFVKQCAGCHRIDGQGVVVGPDISDMRTQTPEQILLSILDPNAAIDANFYRYAVLTADGQLIEGLLEESNQQSVTLRLQDGVRKTFPRDEIEQLRATGVSMMPEGFENQIAPEAMRDLVAYLKRWRLLSGEIPLGQK